MKQSIHINRHPQWLRQSLTLAASLCMTIAVHAEVISSTPTAFVSTHTHDLPLPPDAAWKVMAESLPQWWDASHSWTGKAENLSLDLTRGGCFCERLDNGGWVEHLRVIYVSPGDQLRFRGGLGPLQEMGIFGTMVWRLEATEGGTRFTSTYKVRGAAEDGLEVLAPIVDQVNAGQFERLADYASTQSSMAD